VYVAVPVATGVSVVEPLVASVPDHAPDAVHEVVLVELHVSVVVAPSVIAEGTAAMVTVGCGTVAGLMVTVEDPVILVYPGTVDAAIMVAVVITVIVEEEVNTPPVIVPAVVGVTDQVTTWLGLSCPATVATKEALPPAVTVPVVGVTVTEVTVVVICVLVVPPPPPQPAMAMVRMVKAATRQNSLAAKALDAKAVLRMASPFQLPKVVKRPCFHFP
jgi:hypothetical protein